MYKYLKSALISACLSLAIAGCGGGGSTTPPPADTPTPLPATKATTTVSLFGTMSSNSTIATVKTSMTVPNGVLVNYSSPAPAGYAPDTFPLRSGVVMPSGPVKVAASDFSNSIFNTASRKLTINMVNLNRLPLMGNAIGSGAEIATLNFGLSSTATIASQDFSVEVYQDRLPDSFAIPLNGCLINFSTVYQ